MAQALAQASFSSGLDAVVFIHLLVAGVAVVGWELSPLPSTRVLATKDSKKALGLSRFLFTLPLWDSTCLRRKFLRLLEKWVLWLEFFTF